MALPERGRPAPPSSDVFCPACGGVNPPGYVWCRECKKPLQAPSPAAGLAEAGSRNWPLFVALGLTLLVIGIAIGRRSGSGSELPAATAAPAASSAADSKKALRESLENWKKASESGSSAPSSRAERDLPPIGETESRSPFPPASASSSSAAPPAPSGEAPMVMESVRIQRDGNRTIYNFKVRQNDRSYDVRIGGEITMGPDGPRFEADEVDTGGLPVDERELQKRLLPSR